MRIGTIPMTFLQTTNHSFSILLIIFLLQILDVQKKNRQHYETVKPQGGIYDTKTPIS